MKSKTEDVIERVRTICLALPKVVEEGRVATGVGPLDGTGVVTFKVSGRVVARLFVLDRRDGEDVMLWFRADAAEREFLLGSGRGFLRAGPREVVVKLDDETDWRELAELITDSYLLMAPRKLAAEVEGW